MANLEDIIEESVRNIHLLERSAYERGRRRGRQDLASDILVLVNSLALESVHVRLDRIFQLCMKEPK